MELAIEVVERNFQRIGAKLGHPERKGRTPFDASKLADVVVEKQPAIKRKDRVGVGGARCIEQQLSCHAKVDHQHPIVEGHDDKFAPPLDSYNCAPHQMTAKLLKIAGCDETRMEFRIENAPTWNMRSERPHYRLDFR